jgi:6-phosphogluconate dehydrogenase
MQLGFVGVGRMGAGMIERLRRTGHDVVGYDIDPELSDVASLQELVDLLRRPRHVWIMVPYGAPIENTIEELADLLDSGDLVVEGGNSRWTDDEPRAARLYQAGIGFVDCGVSGGVWGTEQGYALMAGGSDEHVHRLMPVFDALKPPGTAGFVHAGPVGAGHYAKMVHNGIEYGLMESYAEGFELLQATGVVRDVPGVMTSWTEGTVIRSWLLDLAVRALSEDPELSTLRGYAEDSGEGRWTVEAGIDASVPTPAITAALYSRFSSRQEDSPAMRLVAALRREFGGHPVTDAVAGAAEADEPAPGVTPESPDAAS